MNELALFAGVGGGILGTRLIGSRVVCAVEVDPYCREILLRRQEEGHLAAFPIWCDVRTFDGFPWRGIVDVITAGFPCQPFSLAGKQAGADDERNLWPETFRIIQEVRPRHVMLENVPGIRRYLPVVLRDLRRIGYTVKRPVTVAAAAVGAGHIRRRVWVRADDHEGRKLQPEGRVEAQWGRIDDRASEQVFTDAQGKRTRVKNEEAPAITQGRSRKPPVGIPARSGEKTLPPDDSSRRQREQPRRRQAKDRPYKAKRADTLGAFRAGDWWKSEPRLARLVRGPANRVERIAATGNIQVPAVAKAAWELLNS